MPIPIPSGNPESYDRIREQYRIEKELARRLWTAPREVRRRLYGKVYNEFMRVVPAYRAHAEQHQILSPVPEVLLQAALLQPFLSEKALVLEIGAGDCALASYLVPFVGTMIAVDVCEEVLRQVAPPQNLSLDP